MRQSFFLRLTSDFFFEIGDTDAISTDQVRGRGAGAGRSSLLLGPIGHA